VITRAEDDALAIEALSLDGDRPLSLASARGSRGGRAGFIGRLRPALSTDGGRLTYVDPEGTLQMVNIGPDLGASAPQPAAGDRPLDASNLSVAPTGDLAAVVSGSPTQNALALMPLPAAAPTFPIGNNTRSPRWSADGTELFFHQVASAAASYLMAVTVDPAAGRPTGAPVPLFPMTIAPRQYLSAGFDVAPDGQRFLMVLLRQPPTRHVLIEDFDAFMAARAR
jgi:hypothetical protein